jgi:hypothetical protein
LWIASLVFRQKARSLPSRKAIINRGGLLPVSEDILRWIDETHPSSDSLDVSIILSRIVLRLREAGVADDRIENAIHILAPLEFRTKDIEQSTWNCYFAPVFSSADGLDEYPSLAKLTPADVDEWAMLASRLKQPVVRARFADAVWELGKRLGSAREDFHRHAELASELYLEATAAEVTLQNSFSMLELLTRAICLGIQLRRPEFVERGLRRMLAFGESAEQAHIGYWAAPFERLIRLKGLSASQRKEILDQHEKRLNTSIADRNLHHALMAGSTLAKYFHDCGDYSRAKEVTLRYGEAVLEIASGMSAGLETHHMSVILEAYRQAGLRENAERVRILLESRAPKLISEMRRRGVEIPIDLKQLESEVAELINVADPLVALYRLAAAFAPRPQELRKQLKDGGLRSSVPT